MMTMTGTIQIKKIEKEIPYTGPELRPHYLLTQFQMKGDALAAFEGPCRVETGHLVDWEDRMVEDRIEAKRMVHFLGEFFGWTLAQGVLFQRLFMAIVRDEIAAILARTNPGVAIRRDGDDLFIGEGNDARKLSVSIVTASPVSILLHAGINIDPAGAPVPAIGLSELKVPADQLVERVLSRAASELDSVKWACAKVRPVV
ncbi:MAG: DUF366 family protein [Bdellovibrionales bacterium]|nr:DUF366 family protein [Bdellovibrionales bacterium]